MLTITIDTNKTDYYQFSKAKEIARILKQLAKKLEQEDALDNCIIHDLNANKVGEMRAGLDLQPTLQTGVNRRTEHLVARRYRD